MVRHEGPPHPRTSAALPTPRATTLHRLTSQRASLHSLHAWDRARQSGLKVIVVDESHPRPYDHHVRSYLTRQAGSRERGLLCRRAQPPDRASKPPFELLSSISSASPRTPRPTSLSPHSCRSGKTIPSPPSRRWSREEARGGPMDPVELLEFLARSTWRTLKDSHQNHIVFGEDAITSVNLSALVAAPAGIIAIDTRISESTKGCDFELWIGTDSQGWSRYAVQAKRLSVSSGRYAKIDRHVGGRPQIDILDEYARLNRAASVYCFYNYSRHPYAWACSLSDDAEQLGCSVTPLSVVRQALGVRGGRTFSWMHRRPETIPWRCLLRCPSLVGGTGPCTLEGWPRRETFLHPKLPNSLRRPHEDVQVDGLHAAQDLFNPETKFRPARVVVIDLAGLNSPTSYEAAWNLASLLFAKALENHPLDTRRLIQDFDGLKTAWKMGDEVFAIYIHTCVDARRLLPQSEFIDQIAGMKFDPDDPRAQVLFLYLLDMLKRG